MVAGIMITIMMDEMVRERGDDEGQGGEQHRLG